MAKKPVARGPRFRDGVVARCILLGVGIHHWCCGPWSVVGRVVRGGAQRAGKANSQKETDSEAKAKANREAKAKAKQAEEKEKLRVSSIFPPKFCVFQAGWRVP